MNSSRVVFTSAKILDTTISFCWFLARVAGVFVVALAVFSNLVVFLTHPLSYNKNVPYALAAIITQAVCGSVFLSISLAGHNDEKMWPFERAGCKMLVVLYEMRGLAALSLHAVFVWIFSTPFLAQQSEYRLLLLFYATVFSATLAILVLLGLWLLPQCFEVQITQKQEEEERGYLDDEDDDLSSYTSCSSL